jgi:hypothetical protein
MSTAIGSLPSRPDEEPERPPTPRDRGHLIAEGMIGGVAWRGLLVLVVLFINIYLLFPIL